VCCDTPKWKKGIKRIIGYRSEQLMCGEILADKLAQCGDQKKVQKEREKIKKLCYLGKDNDDAALADELCKSDNRIIKEQQQQRQLFIKRVLKQGM